MWEYGDAEKRYNSTIENEQEAAAQMCTSISYRKHDLYFGRTLDVDFSFHEQVVITPRNRMFHLKNGTDYATKYALIGMGTVMDDVPMYYEAANEKGLAMAGLNFPKSAVYRKPKKDMDNIAVFELIPWILGQAETLSQARTLLEKLNLTDDSFRADMPTSPLHFMLSDSTGSLVAEPMADGMKLYENPFDVMTNEPPFDYHRWNMQKYLNLSPRNEENRFSSRYELNNYAVGMGALGLPGDTSSSSRFVRAAFNLTNSRNEDEEMENVGQFFHILDSVSMVQGATVSNSGKDDITLYTCCINATKGIYYYKTRTNNRITAVRLNHEDLDGKELVCFTLNRAQDICFDN